MTQIDLRASDPADRTSSAKDVIPITPNDSADLSHKVYAIRADTGGDVVLITAEGEERTCKFADGETRAIITTRVLATGTTASDLEGLA